MVLPPSSKARVFDALATLPDQAVRELQPGELQQYTVIRVANEILVDLMHPLAASTTPRSRGIS